MKAKIDKLINLGIPENEAIEIVKSIAQDAYETGYSEGMCDEPAIIGESLGRSGMDFFDWWDSIETTTVDDSVYLNTINKLQHSKTRVPYTYHHDYLRQHSKYHASMSRSEVASNHAADKNELYAIALTQILDELGSLSMLSLESKDFEICKIARQITTSAVERYNKVINYDNLKIETLCIGYNIQNIPNGMVCDTYPLHEFKRYNKQERNNSIESGIVIDMTPKQVAFPSILILKNGEVVVVRINQ